MCSDNACSPCSCVRMCLRTRMCSEFARRNLSRDQALEPSAISLLFQGFSGSRYSIAFDMFGIHVRICVRKMCVRVFDHVRVIDCVLY